MSDHIEYTPPGFVFSGDDIPPEASPWVGAHKTFAGLVYTFYFPITIQEDDILRLPEILEEAAKAVIQEMRESRRLRVRVEFVDAEDSP